MKHPDDENELFHRLEADMAADSRGEVVDLDKARSARTESADPTARPDSDPSANPEPGRSGDESGDPTARRMVDLPTAKAAGPGYLGRLLAAQRRPVVPMWLTSLAELKTATAWVARHYAHSAGYHALRSPVYAARLTLQAPSGAAKFVGATMRWVADREGEPVRLAAVRREDAAEYLKLKEIATDLVKRGPATGIVLLLATQRPDAKALPTGISANASARWCLKVMGQLENDMVLGTSAYKRGVWATMFSWADKGIHYFIGEGSDARIVGSVYVDGPGADSIAARARTAREKAGLLSGHALGEEPETVESAYDLLADILAVIPVKETKVWTPVRPPISVELPAISVAAPATRHRRRSARQSRVSVVFVVSVAALGWSHPLPLL